MLNKPHFLCCLREALAGSCVRPDRHRGDRYIKAGVELKSGIDSIADQMLVGARKMQQPHSF